MGCKMAEESEVCSKTNHSHKSILSTSAQEKTNLICVPTNRVSNFHYDIFGVLNLELDIP